jgi:hypothetical protein
MQEDVVGGAAEMQAYAQAKAQMAACAAGKGCTGAQASDAAAGLQTLSDAENDHSVMITLQFGKLGGNSPASVVFGSNTETITIDPNHATVGKEYSLTGVVAHEVHEGYERLKYGHGSNTKMGRIYPYVHGRAVRYGEDPALLGGGLPSRTSRSPGCNVGPRPQPMGAGSFCGASQVR